MTITHTDVLVVGAGPAGLTAAIALGRAGAHVTLVERRTALSPFPRATGVSLRTMELLRAWGLEDDIRAGALDVGTDGWIGPALTALGQTVPTGFPNPAQAAELSPTTPAIAPQDHLEPVLLRHLQSLTGTDVRFGAEVVAVEQDDDGVRADVRTATGVETVHARYVIGADGARSAVRRAAGIGMTGPGDVGAYLAVVFRGPVADLLPEPRHGLHMIVRPGPPWVMLPTDRTDRWVFSLTWDPASESLDDYPRERLVELVRAAAGAPDLPVDIVWTGDFTFTALIADTYRDRRLFLVGDAAHRMTPRGAAGMNTAIRDGYDLGWKLGWVLRGWADESLLATYEAERYPVGLRNVERSAVAAAQRDVSTDYLDELADRIPHAWLPDGRSTLDLLGSGLTLLAGPQGASWVEQAMGLRHDGEVPVEARTVDASTAGVLGIGASGAVLVRPDGRPTTRWAAAPAASALGLAVRAVLFDLHPGRTRDGRSEAA